MTHTSPLFKWVPILNIVVVALAIGLYILTGNDYFDEGGFVTVYSSLQLLTIAFIVFKIHRCSPTKRRFSIWKIIAAGFVFLAFDEAFKIHETIDGLIHVILSIQENAYTDRIDDYIIAVYAFIGLGFLYVYREEFLSYRSTLPYFVLGFVMLFGMVGLDVLTNRNDILPIYFDAGVAETLHRYLTFGEESLKIFAEASFLLGFSRILCMAQQKATGRQ